MSGVGHAAQIASPTIFGSIEQVLGECSVINGSPGTLTVSLKIVDELGATAATSNCDGPLTAGEFCALSVPIDNAAGYACIATGQTANLRGSMALERKVQDSFGLFNFQIIRIAPMR